MPTVQKVGNRTVTIDDDAASVVRRLREIDERFRVHYLIDEAVYTVELHEPQPDGSVKESLVGRYPELNGLIVRRAQEITSERYDLAGELDKRDAELDAAQEHARSEETGEIAERLAFGLRKDLQRNEAANTLNSRAFIPAVIRKD